MWGGPPVQPIQRGRCAPAWVREERRRASRSCETFCQSSCLPPPSSPPREGDINQPTLHSQLSVWASGGPGLLCHLPCAHLLSSLQGLMSLTADPPVQFCVWASCSLLSIDWALGWCPVHPHTFLASLCTPLACTLAVVDWWGLLSSQGFPTFAHAVLSALPVVRLISLDSSLKSTQMALPLCRVDWTLQLWSTSCIPRALCVTSSTSCWHVGCMFCPQQTWGQEPCLAVPCSGSSAVVPGVWEQASSRRASFAASAPRDDQVLGLTWGIASFFPSSGATETREEFLVYPTHPALAGPSISVLPVTLLYGKVYNFLALRICWYWCRLFDCLRLLKLCLFVCFLIFRLCGYPSLRKQFEWWSK